MRLGKIFGIPVSIDPSWFIVFGLIVVTLALGHFPRVFPEFSALTNWVAGIVAALFLFLSVLIHELAHSLIARKEGMEVSGITLFLFGGVSQMSEEPSSPGDEFKMAAAGPGMSLVLAAAFWVLERAADTAGLPVIAVAITGYLAVINLILAVFNLIPAFPLDGGRVLRAIIWSTTNSMQEATRTAAYIGQGFGYLFMLIGFWIILGGALIGGVWLIFIGWFLSNSAQQSYRQLMLHRALEGVRVDRIMTTDVPTVSPDTSVEDLVHNYFLKRDYNVFPVVQEDQFRGIVTLDGVREVPREQWSLVPVSQITQSPEEQRIIRPDEDAWVAMMHMATGDFPRLLVMTDGKLLGVVTRDNLMNLVQTRLELGM